MSTDDRICWNCRFFDHNDQIDPYSGKCRRRAPRGIDANSFTTDSTRNAHRVQMGRVNNGIMKAAQSPVNLYITQGVNVLPVSNGSGFAGDGCFPFVIGGNHKITKFHVSSLLMNTGAASIGTNPVFKIGIYRVDTSTDTLLTTLEIPIPPANLGIAGNVTNHLFNLDYTLPEPFPESVYTNGILWAPKFILQAGSPDVVGEIDNTLIAFEYDYYGPDASTQKLFPWVTQGNVYWCGEFKRNNGTIPPMP